ncbi:hypothetical protein FACS1894217_13260 [Clostridia bacterium]|nr:hypothetical protein FACS1894217_13260 [Clostridia bacterium]
MVRKVIRFGLSEREINRAIKELRAHKQELVQKTNLLRERIAAEIANNAQSGFAGAIVDDLLQGGKRVAEVDVTVSNQDNISIIVANGEDAIWVEFGAGVYHNGSVGSSPHPKGQELGFTIGGYGKGYGKKTVWGYYKDGELRLTHGTPAVMPMMNSVKIVCSDISKMAQEVFGR